MNGTSNPTAPTIPLAEYLFTRIKQLGVLSVHGLPGDYNLTLLDHVEPSGLRWVGSANELNAGYAADGYARVKGVGALVTTFGVGELSAINAIAGAYAERAAVVHIVGTPPRDSHERRLMIHHTLGDGDYRHFARMQAHVTVAQADLVDPRLCAAQIDEVLLQCLVHSRPVYIRVPVDMVSVPLLAERLREPVRVPVAAPSAEQEKALSTILEKLNAAECPIILVDNGVRPLRIAKEVQRLVEATRWPTFTSASGKGLIDMTLSNVYGVYRGNFAEADTRRFVEESDLILCFGPHFSSTNSYGFTSIPDSKKRIEFAHEGITIMGDRHRDVDIRWAVEQLSLRIDTSVRRSKHKDPKLSRESMLPFLFNKLDGNALLRHKQLWSFMSRFFRPGDIVMGETGTAGYGVRELVLPRDVQLFTPMTWLSIGYMLPAAQGAALAQRELLQASQYHDLKTARTILFIGDGSLQLTIQELATIIRHKLDIVIFVLNNDGYTIERAIHGMNQTYNDVPAWNYLQAPSFFGGSDEIFTRRVRTYGALEEVLEEHDVADGKGVRMVEMVMDRLDVPAGPLMQLLQKQTGKSDVEVELVSTAID